MKTRIIFSTLFIAGLFFITGCEEDLLDISQEFNYEQEIQVYTTDTVMNVTEVVDMVQYSDLIDKYGDNIKDVSITDVQYWLTQFEGNDTQEIITSSLKVADENGSNAVLIAEIQNQNLNSLVDNPTDLTVEQNGIDQMAELIKNAPHKFQLIFNTACNEGPLNFTVKFKFKVSFTANPVP